MPRHTACFCFNERQHGHRKTEKKNKKNTHTKKEQLAVKVEMMPPLENDIIFPNQKKLGLISSD